MEKIKVSSLEGQSNYQDWKFQIVNLLKYHGLDKLVNGDWKDADPPASIENEDTRKKYDELHDKWIKADCHATALLTSNMEKDVRDQFRICRSAKDIRIHLKLLYEQKLNQRLDLLYCQLFNYEKSKTDSVIIHVTKLQTLWQDIKDELAVLEPSAKMPDSMLISRILHTLTDDEYIRFNNTWDAMPASEQSINKLTELLRLLEVRIERNSSTNDNNIALRARAEPLTRKDKFNDKNEVKYDIQSR